MSTNDTLRGLLSERLKNAIGLVAAALEADGDRPTSQHALAELKAALAEPVSGGVVLPERREPSQENPYLSGADHEWNACLDDVAALNGGAVAGHAMAEQVQRAKSEIATWPDSIRAQHQLPARVEQSNAMERTPQIGCERCGECRRGNFMNCKNRRAIPICDCRQGRDACTCKGGE